MTQVDHHVLALQAQRFGIPLDPDSYEPTMGAEALISFLEGWHAEGLRARASASNQAALNIAFYQSRQWVTPGKSDASVLERMDRDLEDPDSVMLTINKFAEKVDHFNAKLLKSNPQAECRPVSEEEDDIKSAVVGTRLLHAEGHRLKSSELVLPRTYVWVTPAGWAYQQTTWDDEAKQVSLEIAPHNEVTFDPSTQYYDCERTRWVCRTTALTDRECWERYGRIPSEASKIRTLTEDLQRLASPNPTPGIAKMAVRQLWLRPGAHRSLPRGLCVTWAGKTILDGPMPWPYTHQTHLPIVQFNCQPPMDTPLGRTPFSDIIDMQIDYNAARSVEADIRRRLVPLLLAVKGSIDPDLLAGLVHIVEYEQYGVEPHYSVPNPNWMAQYEGPMNRADSEMGARVALGPASVGDLAGTSPGVTALTLQETAAEPLQHSSRELAAALGEQGWQHLMLIKEFWPDKRLVSTFSEQGRPITMYFERADLKDQLDVWVSVESALPRSKAGRAQLALELHKVNPEEFPFRRVIEMLELPPTDTLVSSYNRQAREAEWENDHMIEQTRKLRLTYRDDIDPQTGVPVRVLSDESIEAVTKATPKIEDWQDDAEHLRIHDELCMTPVYRALPDASKAVIQAHRRIHLERLGTKMQNASLPVVNGTAPSNGSNITADPLVAGMAVPTSTQNALQQYAGTTGGVEGEQGPVPGVDPDMQAALTGS